MAWFYGYALGTVCHKSIIWYSPVWSLLNRVPYEERRLEIAKSRAKYTCQRGLRLKVLACQRGLRTNVPAAQHTKSVPTSQFLQKTCQRVIACANVSNWRANVPNGVPIFQLGVSTCQCMPIFRTFLLRNPRLNFYTLSLFKDFYIILDIIVIRIIYICILHFHTSSYIKE